jgi:arginase
MHEVDKYGIGKVVQMALDHVNPDGDKPLHLSFDVDAMDPTVAPSKLQINRAAELTVPGTGTPVRGGLTFREGHYITEALAETGCLVAVDIMVGRTHRSHSAIADDAQEVNPALLDPVSIDQTVSAGCSLARAAMGETLL